MPRIIRPIHDIAPPREPRKSEPEGEVTDRLLPQPTIDKRWYVNADLEFIAWRLKPQQVRILRVLYNEPGMLTKAKLAIRCGVAPPAILRAIGYDDPAKRDAFEHGNDPCGGFPSLVTLRMVNMVELQVEEGLPIEVSYDISNSGREAVKITENVEIRPPKNSYKDQ